MVRLRCMIRSVDDIEAYRRSKQLYPQVVAVAAGFPSHGRHLRVQLCRAANGIHADVAEGFGRSVAEFKMYLTRALGSCNEMKSHLEDAVNVGWIPPAIGRRLIAEYTIISKQLYRLRECWR